MYITELYTTIPAGEVITIYRSSASLGESRSLLRAAEAGDVSIQITYTSEEIATDHTPFPGTSGGGGVSSVNGNTGNVVLTASDVSAIPDTEKGANGGVATLDGAGRIPASQLPTTSLQFVGTWDADTNTPTLASGVGDESTFYLVDTAGTTSLDGISSWSVGDMVIFIEGSWTRVGRDDQVTSVQGFTGAVSLDSDDVPEGATNLYVDSSLKSQIPSSDEKLALLGTEGTPSTSNRFVTDEDSRLEGTGLRKIATVSPAGGVLTFSDSRLNTATRVQLRFRLSASASGSFPRVRFNGDSSSSYSRSTTRRGSSSVEGPVTEFKPFGATNAGGQLTTTERGFGLIEVNQFGGGILLLSFLGGKVNTGTPSNTSINYQTTGQYKPASPSPLSSVTLSMSATTIATGELEIWIEA